MKIKVDKTKNSRTALGKKLGLKEGQIVLYINKPAHYFDLFLDFPDHIHIVNSADENEVDFIHLFVKSTEELEAGIFYAKPLLKKEGLIWVSWPKGSSKIKTDLKRDYIRTFILEMGLVDVKVCSIDSDWSGLKFVYRLKDR